MNKDAEQKVSKLLDELGRLRKAKGLSYQQLSELTGIHLSTFSLLEKKKRTPTILTCLKLCQALGVRLEDVLRKIR